MKRPALRRPRVNVALAAVSLLISGLLWSVQAAQGARPTMTRLYAVPLMGNGIKADRFAITRIEDYVSVAVTAPEERLKRLNPESFRALADLSQGAPGTRSYPVQIFPPELRDLATNGTLMTKVTLEPIKMRRVPVTLETKGQLPDRSLRLESLVPDPARAVVTGPRGQIDAVVRVRGFLDLGDTREGASADVELEAVDASDRVLEAVRCEPLFARARLAISATAQEKTVLVVPSFKGAPAPGYLTQSYTVAPTQIEVRGRSLALAGLTKATTETVDLTGLVADREFTVRVRLPEGVTPVGRATVKVRVKLQRDPAASPSADASVGTDATAGAAGAPR